MPTGSKAHFSLLRVGHCCHPEAMIARGRSLKSMIFPAIVGLLKHPVEGYILFDTGYACHFQQVTSTFPERFYRMITPVTLESTDSLTFQLAKEGIKSDEIKMIFISHFHADHIAGLRDFPNAKFICSKVGFEFASGKHSKIRKLLKGTLPALLPVNFSSRTRFIEDFSVCSLSRDLKPFQRGYDLFGDSSCIAVSLPGHARGHFGLLFNLPGERPYFLIGDACWTMETLIEKIKPNPLSYLILDNTKMYFQTINDLNILLNNNSDLQLIPSHCLDTFKQHE